MAHKLRTTNIYYTIPCFIHVIACFIILYVLLHIFCVNIQVVFMINTIKKRLNFDNLKNVSPGYSADKCQSFHSPGLSDFEKGTFLHIIYLLQPKFNFVFWEFRYFRFFDCYMIIIINTSILHPIACFHESSPTH